MDVHVGIDERHQLAGDAICAVLKCVPFPHVLWIVVHREMRITERPRGVVRVAAAVADEYDFELLTDRSEYLTQFRQSLADARTFTIRGNNHRQLHLIRGGPNCTPRRYTLRFHHA